MPKRITESTLDLPEAWADLEPFVVAGGIKTPDDRQRFTFALERLRHAHGAASAPVFKRALFTVLRKACGLESFAQVGERFGFDPDAVPSDALADAPAIQAEVEAASAEATAAMNKLEAARQKEAAAQARLERMDALRSELPRLKAALSFYEIEVPARLQAIIDEGERQIRESLYSLPIYGGIGRPIGLLLEVQKDIDTAKAALAAHPERIEIAHSKIAEVKRQIAELRKGKGGSK